MQTAIFLHYNMLYGINPPWHWLLVYIFIFYSQHVLSTLRLVPGPDIGRLEVLHNGEWGTVCDDKFGYEEAKVACRQLGYTRNYSLPMAANRGRGQIRLDDIMCNGTEESLTDCVHNEWDNHDCSHREDVGVYCSNDIPVKMVPDTSVIKVLQKKSFTVQCIRKEGFVDIGVQKWSVPGEDIKSTGTSITLIAKDEDEGTKRVFCSWKFGNITANLSTTIDIQKPPAQLTRGSKRVFEGDHVNICLDVSSNPVPDRFEWRNSESGQSWTNSSSCPTIDSVQRFDAGDYIINIFNTMFNTFTNTTTVGKGVQLVTLKVLYPPSVNCTPEVKSFLNSTVDLHCDIESSPSPNSITWYLDSRARAIHQRGKSATYRMAGLELTDSGAYVCRVRNNMTDDSGLTRVGEAECRTKLTVLPLPARPGLSALSMIWIKYRWYILAGAAVFTMLTVCVCVLFFKIIRRNSSKGSNLPQEGITKTSPKEDPKTVMELSPIKENHPYVAMDKTTHVLDNSASRQVSGLYLNECPDDISEGWSEHEWTGDQKTEDNIYTNTCVEADIYENVEETQDNLYGSLV